MLGADDEPALIGERKRSKHDCVGHREQHRGGADAKGEQEHRDTRELGALQERATCRSQLAHSLTSQEATQLKRCLVDTGAALDLDDARHTGTTESIFDVAERHVAGAAAIDLFEDIADA